ncbi:MAG TPA: DUF5063 domain-containing protein [Candidatus Limnocylindria bacterium]|nr:DUF5063 domain-containing protein [Candidatus Limnocylindria bacterium]
MPEDLEDFASDVEAHARTFIAGVSEIASGAAPETTISALVVQLAQISMAGAMLAAVEDVVPGERYEADAGPDPDADPLREGLAVLLEGIDEYASVFDPLLPVEPHLGRISDDVADVAIDLAHGLRHYDEGRIDEALWWWQFSYLSSWGQHALQAQRALLSIVSHQRLDADDEAAMEAEVDALLRP